MHNKCIVDTNDGIHPTTKVRGLSAYFDRKMTKQIVITILSIGFILVLISGCVTMAPSYSPSASARLQRDQSLIAACQYEWWTNTTQILPILNGYDIKNSTKTTVNWICYYRDKSPFVQKIGDFETIGQAGNYIWYYYENGQYPWIVVV